LVKALDRLKAGSFDKLKAGLSGMAGFLYNGRASEENGNP
jgi:hypothetical protein